MVHQHPILFNHDRKELIPILIKQDQKMIDYSDYKDIIEVPVIH